MCFTVFKKSKQFKQGSAICSLGFRKKFHQRFAKLGVGVDKNNETLSSSSYSLSAGFLLFFVSLYSRMCEQRKQEDNTVRS